MLKKAQNRLTTMDRRATDQVPVRRHQAQAQRRNQEPIAMQLPMVRKAQTH